MTPQVPPDPLLPPMYEDEPADPPGPQRATVHRTVFGPLATYPEVMPRVGR